MQQCFGKEKERERDRERGERQEIVVRNNYDNSKY